jgi:osmotically-inducible protein OsmY
VELTGFSTSLLGRERAEEIAKAVRGVRGVINELTIRTPDVPDAELQHRVTQALEHNTATALYSVRCRVLDGEVTAQGTLQSWAEKQLVFRVLKGVRGVRQIHDRINVRGGDVAYSDSEISAQLRAMLEWDIRIKNHLVSIQTDHGVVQVSGTVGTVAERDHLVTLAYLVGASRVDTSELEIAEWALDRPLRQARFGTKADDDVAQAVRDALRYDPRVRASDEPLQVQVGDGVVMLAGTVDSLTAKRAAEQDADNVVGVQEVHNLLLVRAYYPSPDATIQQLVKAALANDTFVGHYSFTVNVSNGKVQLYGTVDSHSDQQQAAEVAAGVNGVVDLVNNVQVSSRPAHFEPTSNTMVVGYVHSPVGSMEPDHLLEQRIRNHYYWSSLLHNQDIDIMVHQGRVTLTGTVETQLERKSAANEAYACGARDVNNHLYIATGH